MVIYDRSGRVERAWDELYRFATEHPELIGWSEQWLSLLQQLDEATKLVEIEDLAKRIAALEDAMQSLKSRIAHLEQSDRRCQYAIVIVRDWQIQQ